MLGRGTQAGIGQTGLRTRYLPKSRVGHGLVAMAPWLDFALLTVCFLFLHGNIVLQQGMVVDLPETSFFAGLHTGIRVVVLSVEESSSPGTRSEIVFFNDERFAVDNLSRMRQLQDQIASAAENHPDSPLVLQADRNVKHGTLALLLNIAQEVGIKEVNMATRTPGAVKSQTEPKPENE